MQALFGFQLIAVFNQTFGEKLSSVEQALHIVAIGLVAVAIALLMAPAALHRHTEPMAISQRFINVSSRLLMWSMVPLVVGMCIDLFLVARLGLHDRTSALLVSAALLGVFVLMWVVLPQSRALQDAFGATSPDHEDHS
jgi:DMSO reductase anchor subunit